MTCLTCVHRAEHGWYGLSAATHCGDAQGVTGCHETWSGANRLHTVCCHRTFSGESAEKKYHRDRAGRCLTDAEREAKGGVSRGGVWGSPSPVGGFGFGTAETVTGTCPADDFADADFQVRNAR